MKRFGDARRTACLVLATVMVLVTGACGGGSDDDESAPTTTSSTTTSSTSSTTSTTSTTASTTSTTSRSTTSLVATTTTATPGERPIQSTDIPESQGVSYDVKKVTINGVNYTNGLVIAPSSSGGRVEINAGRSQTRFLGDLGVPDDRPSNSVLKVEISLDGAAPVLSRDVRFGETVKVDLDVTNVLRIRITAVPASCCNYQVAIGSPRFGVGA